MHVFKRYTKLINKNKLSRSVEQLFNHVFLATSAQSIYVFWIVGIQQSFVYLPHSDKMKIWGGGGVLPINFTFTPDIK